MELGLLHKGGNDWIPYRVERESTLFLGKKGTGKSTALIRLALDDIYKKRNVVFIDPTGEHTQHILRFIPDHERVQLVSPVDFPTGMNLLSKAHPLLAQTILTVVKAGDASDVNTTRIDNFILAGVETLEHVPGSTLMSLKFLITDKDYRAECLGQVKDKVLLDFWSDFEDMTKKEQRDRTESTLARIRPFLYEPLIRDCIDQKKNLLSFSGVLLVDLREAEFGSQNVSLLGSLILGALLLSRVNTTVYIDEAYRFGSMLDPVLSRYDVLLSARYLSQFREVPHMERVVTFRTTAEDALHLQDEFHLTNDQHGLHELPDHYAYFPLWNKADKLLMPKHGYKPTNFAATITRRSMVRGGMSRQAVRERIARFF